MLWKLLSEIFILMSMTSDEISDDYDKEYLLEKLEFDFEMGGLI